MSTILSDRPTDQPTDSTSPVIRMQMIVAIAGLGPNKYMHLYTEIPCVGISIGNQKRA